MKNNLWLRYISAIIAGYCCLMLSLGSEGSRLLAKKLPKDIFLRRNFLIKNLNGNTSRVDYLQTKDSRFVGVWTFASYSTATFALTNIAMLQPETAKEASAIIARWIEFCIDKRFINFDEEAWGEKPLDETVLNKDTGHIGYYGHLNLMLGCYALLNNDARFRQLHLKLSEAIARRMAKFPNRHVETYPGETFPPDNTVAVVSLRIADVTLGTNYKKIVDEWVEQSKKIEYAPYGLIPFKIDVITSKPVQICRGSNIGWNSLFLPLIDEGYAQLQFKRFKKLMLRRFLGFAAFKEYPRGGWFKVDADSGPVVFGLGGTATACAIAGARWSRDEVLLTELLRLTELIGVSVDKNNERRYIAAPVLGDAILLAAKTSCRWRPLWKESQ